MLRGLASAVAIVLLMSVACPAVAVAVRPNVLIVSLDTVRADAVTVMPALRSLAARGVDFSYALSAGPWTVPSHAGLFTGRNPLDLSCVPNALDIMRGVPTVMTLLAAAGYEVSVITELGVLTEKEGYAEGTTHFWTSGDRYSAIPAVKQWRRRMPQAPWLLVVHTQGAHAPYAPVDLETPERLADLWPPGWTNGWPKIYWEVFRGRMALTPVEAHWLRARYRATARQADRELARLLRLVEPWREETVVIVTSDHGEELGEHGWWVKHGHHLHDVILRVPLVMSGPGIVPGEWPAIVSLLDVAPTVFDLTGVAAPTPLDGVSLRPVLRGEIIAPRTVVSAGIQGNLGTQRTTHPRGHIVMGRSVCATQRVRASSTGPRRVIRRPDGKRGARPRDVPHRIPPDVPRRIPRDPVTPMPRASIAPTG